MNKIINQHKEESLFIFQFQQQRVKYFKFSCDQFNSPVPFPLMVSAKEGDCFNFQKLKEIIRNLLEALSSVKFEMQEAAVELTYPHNIC